MNPPPSTHPKEPLALVLAGEAGQGVQAVAGLLSGAFRQKGYSVFSGQEFMSRIRGGSNSTLLRIASRPVRAWTDAMDLCIVFDEKAIAHLEKRLRPETLILSDGLKAMGKRDRMIDVPLGRLASDSGGKILVNTVAAGIIWGIFDGDRQTLEGVIRRYFDGKTEEIIGKNFTAAAAGMAVGRELFLSGKVPLFLPPPQRARLPLHMTGTEALAMGAMAGGCNFVSSYPMSPATGIWTFIAKHARDFGIVVEQAEDEISAANMVLGAWYAGARGLAATSGGGFALMTEAVSLSGMTETPMVIFIAQRPGPATGLPTRTEQGDLNLALYAGHGEFPRILLAPGNPEQAFSLGKSAFQMADAHQGPVILLTDQYLMDSGFDVEDFPLDETPVAAAIVETGPAYRRYEVNDSGISPRGVPGRGKGLVGVDSDEHDEAGHITEDADVRIQMVEKRLGKLSVMEKNALLPTWIGPEDAGHVVVCWGSTLEIVREAVLALQSSDLAAMHFHQVFPLSEAFRHRLLAAKVPILLEGNATGQFGALLTWKWGIRWRHRLLKYNGFAFSVEEVRDGLRDILQKGGSQ